MRLDKRKIRAFRDTVGEENETELGFGNSINKGRLHEDIYRNRG